MEKTSNYSQFKIIGGNREINQSHVNKIIGWIQERNLLEYRPLLVNEKMEVLDGQHRLKAAEKLGVPVYYIVQEGAQDSEIIDYNTGSLRWRPEDSLRFFIAQGNKNYIELKKYMDKTGANLSSVLDLIGFNGGGHKGKFLRGLLKWPEGEEAKKIFETDEKVRTLCKMLQENLPDSPRYKKYIFGTKFQRTVRIFLKNESIDFDLFVHKIKYNLDLIHPCARHEAYYQMWTTIYNWRNRNPIQERFGFSARREDQK